MEVTVQNKVFWVMTPCSLAAEYRRFEKHAVSIFNVEVCRVKKPLDYVGRLLGRWSLRSMGGGRILKPVRANGKD
jgi:hypothetical protein